MIILDTNVLSEILRPAPDERPLSWLAAPPRSVLFSTAVTRAELFYGARLLPDDWRHATSGTLRGVASKPSIPGAHSAAICMDFIESPAVASAFPQHSVKYAPGCR
ncbi:PIN domain-containing protein [Pollutimonas bauzanensis]|uniref:PIN domain-containing protein n=1 Tax=Pollutimonas bauzanensis TaxID=658167 RepID=UPI001FE7796E|nr:PIN domain-containing protein [Pollutimonas bauzanensis]